MSKLLKITNYSLNIKIFLSFFLLGLLLLTILFLLIIPKMQLEQHQSAQNKLEQMIKLTKEQVLLAGKSIQMQSKLEISETKHKIELDILKNKPLPKMCQKVYIPYSDTIILNTWEKKYKDDNNFNKRDYHNIFYTQSSKKSMLSKISCHSSMFNKNHSTFEKDIKQNIQKSFALTSQIHKGTSYLIWLNKKYQNDNTPLYEENEIERKQKYIISNISNVKRIYTASLSPKEIIQNSNKAPISHKLNNKDTLTWVNIINQNDRYYFILITTAYQENFDKYKGSIFWKIFPASIIALICAIFVGFFIFKHLLKALQNSIEEKEILLKEIHHRVKNNLALTISLIKLQQHKVEDTNTKKILKDIQERIYTMELLHRKLYESKNLNHILVKDYIENLVLDIAKTYTNKVKINFNIDEIYCNIETVLPCALIVNEIVTNSFKYAFLNHTKPTLSIKVTKNNNRYELCIKDNGIGVPSHIDVYKTKTLGLKLINSIAKQQLKGELIYKYDKGAVFIIRF